MLQKLDLPTLQERRKQQRLTFLFKVARGLVPAIPPEDYLTKVKENKRLIKPTLKADFVQTNFVARQARNHNNCFVLPPAKTDIYKNSLFVRTVSDWNSLSQTTVSVDTVQSFKTALKNSI